MWPKTVDRAVRATAGILILASLALTWLFGPGWLWLAAGVGAGLLQSSVTGYCLASKIFRRIGCVDNVTV